MPEVSSETQGKIIAYLTLDGYNQGAASNLWDNIANWLQSLNDDEGNQIFTLSRSRWEGKNAPLSGAAGAKNAYKIALLNGLSAFPELSKEVKYAYGAEIKSGQTEKKRGMGTKKDDAGDNTPKRNIKENKFNYNGWAFKNIYRLAMGQSLSPDYINRVSTVGLGNGKYLDQFDVETDSWTYDGDTPTLEEVVEGLGSEPMPTSASLAPSEVFVPFVPTGASPGMKIKNPMQQDNSKFPPIVAPTPEEEIALSKKEWNRQKKIQGSDPLYDFTGEVLVTFTPSPSDSDMQPITSLISSATDTDAPQNADDFFSDDDWGDESSSDDESTSNNMDDSKWFLTPTLQFSFRKGADAYFRVLGDDTYLGQMWGVSISDSQEPTRVTQVKLLWGEPSTGTEDIVDGFEITLMQDGTEKVIKVKNNEVTEGFALNQTSGGYNYLGGVTETSTIGDNDVLLYAHGVKGFGGLLNKNDNIDAVDTLSWFDLNNSGRAGEYNGDVSISQSSLIGPVIRTQISRFYGNPDITDMTAFWKNWSESGGANDIMSPIKGGNNIIFNLSKQVVIQADIKLYAETRPDYLQPKSLKLNITGEVEGENWSIPNETDEIGVLSPNASGEWSSYIDFVCKGATASNYFPVYGAQQRFILPGDEKYLEFITAFDEDKKPIGIRNEGRIADSIKYITYDKSSVVMKDGSMVVPQVKVAFLEVREGEAEDEDDIPDEIEELKFFMIPDAESDFYAKDINGEIVGGMVEGGEMVPPDPQIVIVNNEQIAAYNRLEDTRRADKQSPSHTIKNESGEIVTNSIAWLMGEQIYYIVATNENNESYMVKVDLRVPRRG